MSSIFGSGFRQTLSSEASTPTARSWATVHPPARSSSAGEYAACRSSVSEYLASRSASAA